MRAEHINAFLESTGQVIRTMVKVPITLGKPRLRERNAQPSKVYRVAVTIELSGRISGLVVISLSTPVALALAGGLMGEVPKALNADCCDAIAELTNMIAGSAKQQLSAGAGDGAAPLSLSLPVVRVPDDVRYPADLHFICIPVDCPNGHFLIEVGLRSQAIAPATPRPTAAAA